MPKTSMLDSTPVGIALLPGEDHVNLRPDPFYGQVEVGERPVHQPESPKAQANRLQREVLGGVHVLDGEEQNHIEVMTGKRLQQKEAPDREELPPPVDLEPPVVTSLDPSTAVIGTPSFTLRVKGEHFVDGSVIVFNGFDEPTTFVSDTEVTTGVNMDVWGGPSLPLPVAVRNPDDVLSNEMPFTFTAAEGGSTIVTQQGKHGASRKAQPVSEVKEK